MEIYKVARSHKVLGLRRSSFLWCFFILFYIMYLITGSFMFAALESPLERTLTNRLKEKYTKFLMDHSSVSEKDLQNLIEEVVKASKRGIVLKSLSESNDGQTTIESNWSFSQSFFFVVTLVTTIGYGHITPISQAGKLFCIFYTSVGIPLTLVFGSAAVQRLMIPVTEFQHYLLRRLSPYMNTFYIKILHLLIVTLFILTLALIIPAAIFAYIEEDWDILDALYYCFITMTTVGLGDFIPGDGPKQKCKSLYKFVSAGYLLVDLVSILLIVLVFNDIPELNIGILFKLERDNRTNDPERVHLNESGSIARNYTEGSSTDLMISDRGPTPIPDDPSVASKS